MVNDIISNVSAASRSCMAYWCAKIPQINWYIAVNAINIKMQCAWGRFIHSTRSLVIRSFHFASLHYTHTSSLLRFVHFTHLSTAQQERLIRHFHEAYPCHSAIRPDKATTKPTRYQDRVASFSHLSIKCSPSPHLLLAITYYGTLQTMQDSIRTSLFIPFISNRTVLRFQIKPWCCARLPAFCSRLPIWRRTKILDKMQEGDELHLALEPENKHDDKGHCRLLETA